jgi:hypothetical protein
VTAIAWDQVGERYFETGVDRGVLYLNDGGAVPWNGLVSVEDGSVKDVNSYYLDGVKYLEQISPGDFSGKLKAITYPAEFDRVNGIVAEGFGLAYYDQPPQDFSLSYRTRVGNDVDGIDHGYKIHLLYNLVADPDATSFETVGSPLKPAEFNWTITGTPPPLRGHRPTVHVSIDSTRTEFDVLNAIEDILYGTSTTEPRLPSIDELGDLFKTLGALIIVDNGDGTWTAIDTGDDYITMLNSTTFQIDNADATYLDATTYQISTTNPE